VILNIYKPKGLTSFDVVAQIRNKLGVKKVGHAGTLDPLAEGVLIVLTESDTKRQSEFMLLDKEYVAEIAFGGESPTYDLEYPPMLSDNQVSLNELKENLPKLILKYSGEFIQKAPSYSAKKVHGKALYLSSRKGKITSEDDLPTKMITVRRFTILDVYTKEVLTDRGLKSLPTVKCVIECSSGTYIRSIAHDLGKELHTGGVLISLVRTRIGSYKIEDATKLD